MQDWGRACFGHVWIAHVRIHLVLSPLRFKSLILLFDKLFLVQMCTWHSSWWLTWPELSVIRWFLTALVRATNTSPPVISSGSETARCQSFLRGGGGGGAKGRLLIVICGLCPSSQIRQAVSKGISRWRWWWWISQADLVERVPSGEGGTNPWGCNWQENVPSEDKRSSRGPGMD